MENDSGSGISWFWRIAAAGFLFINIGGIGWAIAMGEPAHGLAHVVVLFGGYLGWKFIMRDKAPQERPIHPGDSRIEYLQQSVDAIALEVERIGEAQRYHEKLQAEKAANAQSNQR